MSFHASAHGNPYPTSLGAIAYSWEYPFQERQLNERNFYDGNTADTPHFRVRVWTVADGSDGQIDCEAPATVHSSSSSSGSIPWTRNHGSLTILR